MRYYDISVTEPKSGNALLHYTTHPNGVNAPPDPGALRVEFDVLQLTGGQANANSMIQVWGVPLSFISAGANFNLKNCTLKGGMGRGLPLANPSQAGMLVGGQVIQSFANWIGTDMTLTLILQPGYAPDTKAQEPRNMPVNMPAKTPMSQMLDQVLRTGFPGLQRQINISPRLVLPNPEVGFYSRLPQLAQYVKNLSRKIMGSQGYSGVEIRVHGNTVYAYDGTQQQSVKDIQPVDLVGQPTWIALQTIQVTMVMRGDLQLGDFVRLPKTLLNTQAASNSAFSPMTAQTAFQGKYQVMQIRHVGASRQADGRAWVTIVDCLQVPQGGFNPDDLGPGYGMQTGPNAT